MYPETLPAIRRLMALRQTLTPYFYDLLWRYHRDYEPVVRPAWYDFPADPGAWAESDDHLLGRDLLVALVVEQGATTRDVRPPAGADWIDLWSGARLAGGVTATLPAPLDGPPVLIARAGSAIPVDLARGGYRPEPFCRGLWLFPHAGDDAFDWSFFEDEGEAVGPHDIWHGACRSTADAIEVTVARDGPGTFGDDTITLLLPQGETRRLVVTGDAQPVEIDGRRGVSVRIG
jgi:alpha-glucosidase